MTKLTSAGRSASLISHSISDTCEFQKGFPSWNFLVPRVELFGSNGRTVRFQRRDEEIPRENCSIPTEGRSNTSELRFLSSEVSFHSSELLFRASEQIRDFQRGVWDFLWGDRVGCRACRQFVETARERCADGTKKSPTSAELSVGLRMVGAEGGYRLVRWLTVLVVSVLDA